MIWCYTACYRFNKVMLEAKPLCEMKITLYVGLFDNYDKSIISDCLDNNELFYHGNNLPHTY